MIEHQNALVYGFCGAVVFLSLTAIAFVQMVTLIKKRHKQALFELLAAAHKDGYATGKIDGVFQGYRAGIAAQGHAYDAGYVEGYAAGRNDEERK